VRLRAEQVESHLLKNLAPVYLVHGDEALLVLEAADAVRAAARKRGHSEREVLFVERGFDWGAFTQSAASQSLFGDRKIVELRFASGKPLAAAAQALPADPQLMEALDSIGTRLGKVVERKKYERKLVHDAYHDGLTGLPNRALFLDHLSLSLARGKRNSNYLFAVLFLDRPLPALLLSGLWISLFLWAGAKLSKVPELPRGQAAA